MSDEPTTDGPSVEDLLDNTPEAVAMRLARAQRAEARAKAEAARARAEEEPAPPGTMRRKLIFGAVLGIATAARVLAKVNRTSRPR
jgi:hypothetical protein